MNSDEFVDATWACEDCDGDGDTLGRTCPRCNGSGRLGLANESGYHEGRVSPE